MKKLHIIIAGILLSSVALGQTQFTLYQLNSRLPQANQVNPALFPEYKITIGLPVISSTFASLNTGNLTFNNAFTKLPNDSLQFDPTKLLGKLDKYNRIEFNANTQLFHLGIKAKKNYFSVAISERAEGAFTYPRTFIELLASGNGEYIDKPMEFNNLGARVQAYHEFAVGYGRDITDKLSVGARVKFLSGIVSADVDKAGASFLTTYDSLYFETEAINLNTSGTYIFEDNIDVFDAFFGFKNTGLALDLGASYMINDKLSVSMSVNDLGYINWTEDTQQVQIAPTKYAFYGIDLLDIINSNDSVDPFEQLGDTLQVMFEPDSIEGKGFTTNLATKLYAGATYEVGKHHTFGATVYGDFLKGTFNPAFGLSYNLELGQIWTIGINASYRNKTISNLGVGTTLTLGPIQLYALTERLNSVMNLYETSFVDARVGMNIVIGKQRESKRIRREKKQKEPDVQEDISTTELTEPVTIAIMGDDIDELSTGFYIVIGTFESKDEANNYCNKLHDEGYAALNGYQSEKGEFYAYLMNFPDDGNKAIEKKNELKGSFAPGLEDPWVLWVQSE